MKQKEGICRDFGSGITLKELKKPAWFISR